MFLPQSSSHVHVHVYIVVIVIIVVVVIVVVVGIAVAVDVGNDVGGEVEGDEQERKESKGRETASRTTCASRPVRIASTVLMDDNGLDAPWFSTGKSMEKDMAGIVHCALLVFLFQRLPHLCLLSRVGRHL